MSDDEEPRETIERGRKRVREGSSQTDDEDKVVTSKDATSASKQTRDYLG